MSKDIFDEMGLKWPSAAVARTEIKKFSGGLVSPKLMSNADSLGLGPAGRFTCGRKVAYPLASLIAWMRERSSN